MALIATVPRSPSGDPSAGSSGQGASTGTTAAWSINAFVCSAIGASVLL